MNNDNGNIYFATRIDNERFRQDAAESRRILQGVGQTAVSESANMQAAFSKLGTVVAGAFSVQQATAFIRKVVDVRGEIESLEKSFTTLAGKKGIPLFEEIKNFAVSTPMMMNDLAKGAQTLMSFNIAAEEVMPILRSIGDVAMGDSQKFNSLILAFSQMTSTGKLMGQDLLQMINAGFNPLSVISEKTGKSISKLKDEMSAGAISASMVKQAFMDATSEGGKFYGMLESQSRGIKGSLSNLKGAWENALNEIGKNAQGVITGSIQAAQQLVENYEKIGKILAELIAVFGTYKAALIATNAVKVVATQLTKGYTIAEIAQYNALLLVEKAQALLNKTILANPYALAAAAVAALAYGLYKYFEVENQCKKATDDHEASINRLNEKYADEQNHTNSLIDAIRSETTARADRIAAMTELKNLYPEIFSKHIDEKGHIRDLIALQRELNEAQSKKRYEDELDSLAEARTYLRDYQQLQTALNNGWDWATARTTHNVNSLTEDRGFWQSKQSFVKEKIAYWEKRLQEQQKVVDASSLNQFIASLEQKTVEQLNESKAWYDRFDQLSEQQVREVEAIDAELAKRKPKTVTKDKSYWEQYKKEQQAMLDAMTEAELNTAKAAQIRKNIAEAEKKIEAYNVKGTNKNNASDSLNAADRAQKIQAYAEAVQRQTEQAELDIEQTEINALKDGYEKQSRQIELNYKRLIAENKERRQEWLEALRDNKEVEWQQNNPDYKEKGLVFDRSSVTEADLSEDQLNVLKMYEDIAKDYRKNENDKLLKGLLNEYASYEERRTELARQYEEQRKQFYELDEKGDYKKDDNGNKILKNDAFSANVAEINYAEEQAMQALDEQFAAREATYQAWCENLTNLTLTQLMDILDKAEQELAKVQKEGEGGQKLATARAAVTKVKQEVEKKNAKTNTAPDKRSIEKWNDLREALEDCRSSFEEIGDTIGGVAGEVISTAGSIMGSTLSMVNGIVQLVQSSATGMTATAAAGAQAISTMEKASVILAVISAALQIAMTIANLFTNEKDKEEHIANVQRQIDDLKFTLEHPDIENMRKNWKDSTQVVSDAYADMAQANAEYEKARKESMYKGLAETYATLTNPLLLNPLLTASAIINMVQEKQALKADLARKKSELLEKATVQLADTYANLGYTVDKALGEKRYEDTRKNLENIAKQQLLLQDQIATEQSKKKPDSDAIAEYERQIEELGQEAVQIINDIVEEIIGGSSNDISNELSDAFFTAFENGEDAAVAWGEKVKEITGDILKRMMVQKFLEEPLGEIFDKYKSKWFPNGTFAGIDTILNTLTEFSNDINSQYDDFSAVWNALPDDLKALVSGAESAREASETGIATASQESVDEFNGRMTAVQGHTYTIVENMKMLLQITTQILQSVLNIESNTDRIDERMSGMEDDLSAVKYTLNDMSLKGIKIR